ncbi:hypothetical protein GCG21_05830 [Pseudactinotalea sp. HY160]|uniref:transglutaminase family protein n=1 Tax=Pseudactinotalea sp. HY160 TaxID=2654490 RepID=UPI00128C5BBC|nr:transglutaminase domain-containing protein [Pseudactinotalea sp. HY160]MPV49530.1 hypothetical protein [Pseudactinotalea sp. HY160]
MSARADSRAPAAADVVTWAALVAAVLAPTTVLRPLIDPAAWWSITVAGLAVAGLTLALARPRIRPFGVPSLLAAATGSLAVIVMENPQERWLVLPSPTALTAVAARVRAGLEAISSQAAPVEAEAGLGLVVAAGALVAFLLAEAFAVGCRAPALAGLPLLALWTPALLWNGQVAGAAIAVTIGAFLLVLAAQARPERARGSVTATATTLACAAVALALAVAVVPRVAALDVPRTYTDIAAAGSGQRLDLGLDLRDDLIRGPNSPVFTYTGVSPGELGALHTHTLSDFTGRQWRARSTAEEHIVLTTRLWPTAPDPSAANEEVTFTLPGVPDGRLPLPEMPRVAQTPQAYLPERDELMAQDEGGQSLTLTLVERPDSLDYWRGLDPSTLDRNPTYLDVPATGFEDEIAARAAEVTAGAASPYEQVLAIQNYLRNDPSFQYTTSVGPEHTNDAVWDFLNDGRGYCVQFATAMIVMVRTLGIEARMAVGYLPGDDEGGGGVVRAHDAHAWPQVRFPEAGWVRFEPTPSDRTSTAPAWASDPADAPPTEAPSTTAPTEPASEDPTTATSTTAAAAIAGEDTGGSTRGWTLALAAAIVAAAAAAGIVLTRRRDRERRATSISAAWDHALRMLGRSGLDDVDALTPLQVAALGADRLGELETADGAAAIAALSSLAVAMNDHRYGPAGSRATPEQAWRWADQLAAALGG